MKTYRVMFVDGKEAEIQAEEYTTDGTGEHVNFKFKAEGKVVVIVFARHIKAIGDADNLS